MELHSLHRSLTWGLAIILLSVAGWSIPAIADDELTPIFDGKTLDGWHAIPEDSAGDWSVQDGVIVAQGSVDQLAYLVWKDENLKDFELELSYRFPDDGNSGVEIRAIPDKSGKRPFEGYHADFGHVGIGKNVLGAWDFHFATREEYPCFRGTSLIIDKDGKWHASDIKGAVTREEIHRGEWNHVRVVAKGNHFQFFINGKIASEFTDNAEEGRLDSGAIGLQIHDKGMRVDFKDIRLKKLGSSGGSSGKK
jgi:hypothetical protein